jgi:hypothetical protein
MATPALIALSVVALTGLAFYAMRNKVRFTIRATVAKIISFDLEVESQNEGEPEVLPAKSAAPEDVP